MKTLVGYCLLRLVPSLMIHFEPFELKPLLENAREINLVLSKAHSYEKCSPHVDLFEIRLCDFYLSNDSFGRLSRKFLVRTMDPKWQIQARWAIMRRQGDLIAKQSKQRHINQLSKLLDSENYKNVAHGEISYIALLYDQIADKDKPGQGKECLELQTKQFKFVEERALPYKAKTINLDRTMVVQVY